MEVKVERRKRKRLWVRFLPLTKYQQLTTKIFRLKKNYACINYEQKGNSSLCLLVPGNILATLVLFCYHHLLNYINFTMDVFSKSGFNNDFSPFWPLMSRYVLGDDSQLQAFLVEEDRSTPNRFQDLHSSDESLSWLPEIIKDFVLPAGFPGD